MAVKINKSRPVIGQSFKGVKRLTVPGQSMSLKEILRRFVRRETLPQVHEGLYEERFGDLEKIAHMDIFDQMEKVKELKSQIAAFEARTKAAKEAAVAKAAQAGVSPKQPAVPDSGGDPSVQGSGSVPG